jgi:succinoglycan biosynthesis protein ExoL
VRLTYVVHDLNDAAVRRRVRMFQIGGAEVALAGFRRGETAPGQVEGVRPLDLGRTYDAKLASRALSVGRAWLDVARLEPAVAGADAIVARNLESLALAVRARDRFAPTAPVVYECLDVHRMMLAPGAAGLALRALERRLTAACELLIVSSPAFLSEYFEPFGQAPLPGLLVENKPLDDPARPRAIVPAGAHPIGPPWRIGWYGAIRCARSLALLSDLARKLDGRVEVVIRGRPSPAVFPDFEAAVAGAAHLTWTGPYRNPEDLATIYGGVHFTWAFDFFEAGLNSAWLLPNRLYEGCLHGTVPLAQASVETGRRLAAKGLGALFDEPLAQRLERFFRTLAPEGYAALRGAVERVPRSAWACGPDECRAVVETIQALGSRKVRRAA